MGNTNGEKVTAIVRAWAAATDTTPELMAQIAVNVLTDWDKRDLPGWNT